MTELCVPYSSEDHPGLGSGGGNGHRYHTLFMFCNAIQKKLSLDIKTKPVTVGVDATASVHMSGFCARY